MLDGRWKSDIERRLRPIGTDLSRTGLTADHLTLVGMVMAVATAVAVANGALRLGVLLLVASALPDALDGAVAKASGTAGPRGSFFDSVADRVTDSLALGGIGWYLASEDGGHAALLPFAVMATAALISYERAKAESLGFTARGGLMERLERIVILGVGLFFEVLLIPVLWLMLSLSLVTAVQRFAKVWAQASAPAPVASRPRWRARRVARRRDPALRRRAYRSRRS
ncbi:MAG: CDP-alcohol phosphatidyltransferase family protein [Actinobacteria bacterium]|nr:CDP-alcohol phosphatidyltransferase family protein [Actinomycetota bacterium]